MKELLKLNLFCIWFYSFECNPYLLKYFPLQSQFNVFFLYKMGVLPLLIQLLNIEIEWVNINLTKELLICRPTCKDHGYCVLKASVVECWLTPLINLWSTLCRYLDWHSVNISINTWLMLDQKLFEKWLSVNWLQILYIGWCSMACVWN